MRRIALLTSVALALALLGAGPVQHAVGRSHQRRARCLPHHWHVVVANRRAEVFRAEGFFPEGCVPSGNQEYFGRAYGHSGIWELGFPKPGPNYVGSPSGEGWSERFVLAGTIVAYYDTFTGGYGSPGWDHLIVRGLPTGRVLHHLPSGPPPPRFPEPFGNGFGPVVAIVLKPDGSVAWINAIYHPTEYAVHVADRHGVRDLTAYEPSIAPSSLRSHGSTVSWQDHGRLITAPFH
jgi:hypothetical protein